MLNSLRFLLKRGDNIELRDRGGVWPLFFLVLSFHLKKSLKKCARALGLFLCVSLFKGGDY